MGISFVKSKGHFFYNIKSRFILIDIFLFGFIFKGISFVKLEGISFLVDVKGNPLIQIKGDFFYKLNSFK